MKKFLAVISFGLLVIILVCSGCAAATSTYTQTQTSTYYPTSTFTHTYTTTTYPIYTTTAMPNTTHIPATTATYTYTYTVTTPIITATVTQGGYPTTTPGYYVTTTTMTTTIGGGTIGLSAGGAKDITNFRQNVHDGYLPMPTDITYEGLFYDYMFDTGAQGPSNKLFSPSYSTAVTKDPLSQQTEYYMSVGLNSGLKESDFQRKKLNLVLVLDTSGSMQSNFDQYYYDNTGNMVNVWEEEGTATLPKIESAKRAVITILDQLNRDDSFALVTYDSNAHLVKDMGPVGECNMNDVENYIWNLTAGGSTNLDSGIDMATRQFRNLRDLNNYEYENRMIILTDAEPNTGDTSSYGLSNAISTNANNRIYTTFIGIGVDFNSNLIEQISKTKGANYYSVHSPRQFKQRMEDEFDYMATPLVFDVSLKLESSAWKIDEVFGSPQADETTGELMRIDTLFPAKNEGGEVKGGIVLLKLRKISSQTNQPIYLKVTYEDRNGRRDGSQAVIYMENYKPEYFDNTGIRKGILLVRYASLLKNWMADERQHMQYNASWEPCINDNTGITIPDETIYGQWERTSLSLTCSPQYKYLINKFDDYFIREMNAIGDDSLSQELTVMSEITR